MFFQINFQQKIRILISLIEPTTLYGIRFRWSLQLKPGVLQPIKIQKNIHYSLWRSGCQAVRNHTKRLQVSWSSLRSWYAGHQNKQHRLSRWDGAKRNNHPICWSLEKRIKCNRNLYRSDLCLALNAYVVLCTLTDFSSRLSLAAYILGNECIWIFSTPLPAL